jgi:hypothetical protein
MDITVEEFVKSVNKSMGNPDIPKIVLDSMSMLEYEGHPKQRSPISGGFKRNEIFMQTSTKTHPGRVYGNKPRQVFIDDIHYKTIKEYPRPSRAKQTVVAVNLYLKELLK